MKGSRNPKWVYHNDLMKKNEAHKRRRESGVFGLGSCKREAENPYGVGAWNLAMLTERVH